MRGDPSAWGWPSREIEGRGVRGVGREGKEDEGVRSKQINSYMHQNKTYCKDKT